MIDYSKKRFLVVDDFSDFRSAVSGMLRQMAVSLIDTAATGEEALSMCRNTRYDVILHDYNLGGGKNGQQVLEELRHGQLISPHSIFIMVTAERSQAMVMAALECEPDAYLTKPFNRAGLQQRLDRLVERKLALKPVLDALALNDALALLKACEHTASIQPQIASQCWRYKAEALGKLGQHAQLESFLDRLLSDRPVPWALIALADHWRQLGELDKARELYERGMGLFPMLPGLYDGLAALYSAQGDTLKAQEYLQQGLRISPNTLRRQVEMGRLASQNEDHEQAVRAYRHAVELGRHSVFRSPENHLKLAGSLNAQSADAAPNPRVLQEIRRTLGELEKTWRHDSALNLRANLLQAQALVNNGQQQEAQQYTQAASARLAELEGFFSADTALEVADQLRSLGQSEQADQVLATCAEMYGDDPAVMSGIAEQTDDPQILAAGSQALEWNREGIALYQQKHYPEALELFRKAFASQPRNISFALNTAQSLLRLLVVQADPALQAECQTCLDQAGGMPADDHRHARYRKLRHTLENL